jgi:hypothetical protein
MPSLIEQFPTLSVLVTVPLGSNLALRLSVSMPSGTRVRERSFGSENGDLATNASIVRNKVIRVIIYPI